MNIAYAGKMCNNAIIGGHINFMLWVTWGWPPNEWGTKWLPCQRRLPSNGCKNSGADLQRIVSATYELLMISKTWQTADNGIYVLRTSNIITEKTKQGFRRNIAIFVHCVCHLATLERFDSFQWQKLWRSGKLKHVPQKILFSTLVSICLSDWPFIGFICSSILRFSSNFVSVIVIPVCRGQTKLASSLFNLWAHDKTV